MSGGQYFGETDREFSLRSQLIVAKARIEALEEQRDATYKQMDEILIRRNKRIAELEEWIRNKRDANFEFACRNIVGWTKDKDSFYAECTEILERK